MEEKRKFKRRELQYNLKIYEADGDELVGYIVDVNAQGLKIFGDRPFDPGQHLNLFIKLPEPILSKKKVAFSAQVQWCKPDLNPDLIATGLRFHTISPADHEVFIWLMARFSMNK